MPGPNAFPTALCFIVSQTKESFEKGHILPKYEDQSSHNHAHAECNAEIFHMHIGHSLPAWDFHLAALLQPNHLTSLRFFFLFWDNDDDHDDDDEGGGDDIGNDDITKKEDNVDDVTGGDDWPCP